MTENSLRAFEPGEAILNTIRRLSSLGQPYVADLATVQFLNARVLSEHQMHCVTFLDMAGKRWHVNYFLSQFFDGSWYVKASKHINQHSEPSISHTYPWLYIIGGELAHDFFIGGQIRDDTSSAVVRVRLSSPNGLILEDRVQEGLVLFWSDQEVLRPLQAELLNRSGEVVSRHIVLEPFRLPPNTQFRGFFTPKS